MKNKVTIIGIIIGIFCLFSIICVMFSFALVSKLFQHDKKVNKIPENSFYWTTSGFDYKRIPLVEPYEVLNYSKNWMLGTKTNSPVYNPKIAYVKQLNVVQGVIISYSNNGSEGVPYEGTSYPEVWYVIVPNEKVEIGFTKKQDFLDYLNKRNINDPQMFYIDELYKELVDKGYLSWFPEEYK